MLVDNREVSLGEIEKGAKRLDMAYFTLSLGRRWQHLEAVAMAGLSDSRALQLIINPGSYIRQLGEQFEQVVAGPTASEERLGTLGARMRERAFGAISTVF